MPFLLRWQAISKAITRVTGYVNYPQPKSLEVRGNKPHVQPLKKLYAFIGRGRHYFIQDGNSRGPFCSRECQKLDDNAGPPR